MQLTQQDPENGDVTCAVLLPDGKLLAVSWEGVVMIIMRRISYG